jgi:hypothetical protein
MELETRYRVFRLVRNSGTRRDVYQHVLEGCSADEFSSEKDAKDWVLEHGDFRNAIHEYVILPCLKVMQ